MGTIIGLIGYVFNPLIDAPLASGWKAILTGSFLSLLLLPYSNLLYRGGGLVPFNTPSWSLFFEYIANIVYALVAAVGWDKVTPFSLVKGSQFRPDPPYGKSSTREAIKTKQYIADYNEIKDYGGAVSSKRTTDQTNLANFWVEGSPEGWHKVARAVSAQKTPDMWKAARLFALVHIALADAYIGSADAKMYYFFWRPVSAVTLNNLGQTPGTTGDPTWDVLVSPTPPIPDYPSAHATAGGAVAQTLADFFGKDQFSFSFTSNTADPSNPTRKFKSLSEAAREIRYPACMWDTISATAAWWAKPMAKKLAVGWPVMR